MKKIERQANAPARGRGIVREGRKGNVGGGKLRTPEASKFARPIKRQTRSTRIRIEEVTEQPLLEISQ